MEIQQAIEIRRSIRAYGDRPVEREKLEAVLRAGNQAPIFGRLHMSVLLSAPGGLDEKGFNMANVSCAAENMLLAAAGLGLGSCFLMGPMAAFSDPALRARLELPGGYEPLVGEALGYAALERPAAPERTDAGITWCR